MTDKQLTSQNKNKHENFHDTVNLIKNYAVLTLNLEGQITSWNTGAELIHGWQEHEVSGKNVAFLYSDEEVQQGKKPLPGLQEAREQGLHEEETYLKKKDGTLFLA